jgi:hypothetical protein
LFVDPIHAMDPSKIDGFLDVPTRPAEDRHTHDNRPTEAIRSYRTPARIVEVTRAVKSAISMVESTRPATRLLDDAFAIADEAVPEAKISSGLRSRLYAGKPGGHRVGRLLVEALAEGPFSRRD